MKLSAIGWTDYSGGDLNFVSGCTPVSEGCQNCYARAIYERFRRDFSRVVCDENKLRRAFNRSYGDYSPKRGLGHKPTCFVCDTGDLFHEDVPTEFIWRALDQMAANRRISWQLLTKRPERMRHIMTRHAPLPTNIWLGVTAESQDRADERIPILLDIPAAVRFVSVEPMLTPVDVQQYLGGLSWVICGAESSPNRRPFDVAWAEALYQQCKAAGVPFFGKQGSAHRPGAPLVLSDGIVRQWP